MVIMHYFELNIVYLYICFISKTCLKSKIILPNKYSNHSDIASTLSKKFKSD